MGGTPNLTDTTLYAQLSFISATIGLYKSSIGNFSVSNLENVVKVLIGYVLPMVNGELKNGFKLPVVDKIALVNPTFTFGQDYLAITSRLKYTGSGKPNKGRSNKP